MSVYLQDTQAACFSYKAALDADAGVPARGVTYGGPDRVHPTIPGPGWTITITPAVVAVDANTAALEIPDDQAARLGKRGVPTLASAKLVTELPVALRTAVYAREGKDASGQPLPDPFLNVAKEDAQVDAKAR